MDQLEESKLISRFTNAVISRHRNPVVVIRSLANLMATMATMLDDNAKVCCANVLRDCADIMERDVMKRMQHRR